MKDLIKAINDLPWIVKIILCVPALDVVWSVYRIIKGIEEKNTTLLIVGIIWIIGAFSFGWIFDIITAIISKDRPALT